MEDRKPAVHGSLREIAVVTLLAILIVLGGGYVVGIVAGSSESSVVHRSMPLLVAVLEAALFLPIWVVLRRHGLGWQDVGFRPPTEGWPAALQVTLSGLFFSYLAIVTWGLILLPFGVRPQENIFPRLFGTERSVFVLVLLAGAVVAPLAEETLFRGFLFAGLLRHVGERLAYGVSALCFAVVHFAPLALPPLFVLGVVLAWLYQRTRSIWPSVVLHAAVNTVTLFVWYAEVIAGAPSGRGAV